MKLWLTKNSEVPMRDQLVTQIRLGIASEDLPTGEKLPSRQEIARRFHIHANTVSNAYKDLVERGLVQFRQGSGFYVNDLDSEGREDHIELDTLITKFFQTALSLGFSNDEVKESLEKRLSSEPPKNVLVIESNKNLSNILVEEIRRETGAKVFGITFEDFVNEHQEINSNFVALFDEEQKIEAVLNSDETCLYLKLGSVPAAMQGATRPSEDSLIALVSGWPRFLMTAKTILIAAKIESDSIIVRSTDEDDWKRGLESASLIICDSVAAREFPNDKRVRIFKMISNDSIKELTEIIGDKAPKSVTR